MIVSQIFFLAFLFRSLIYYERITASSPLSVERAPFSALAPIPPEPKPHRRHNVQTSGLIAASTTSVQTRYVRKGCAGWVVISLRLPEGLIMAPDLFPFPLAKRTPPKASVISAPLLNSTADMLLCRQKTPPKLISKRSRNTAVL